MIGSSFDTVAWIIEEEHSYTGDDSPWEEKDEEECNVGWEQKVNEKGEE